MRILIADDEPLARDRLRRLLAELPEHTLVGEARNGRELLEQAKTLQPDIVLLDIRMPDTDGLQAARALARGPLPPAVIFTTAHVEHALSALDSAPSAYLLKPIRREQLAAALARAQQPRRAQLAQIARQDRVGSQAELTLRHGRDLQRLSINRILCCLADEKRTRVIHLDGETCCDLSLRDLESLLPDGFLRVHRSALVAVDHIEALERHADAARLRVNGLKQTLPVSRRRLAAVRRVLHSSR